MSAEERDEQDRAVTQEDEAEMMARLQEEIRNLPVSEHIVYMMHSLSTLAAGRLGLVAEAAAQRDLEQARLAIDAFRALAGVLEGVRPAGEMAAHRGMLSQLQLAYVAAMDAGPSEASEAPQCTEAAPRAASRSTEGAPPVASPTAEGASPAEEGTTVAAEELPGPQEPPKPRAPRRPRKPRSEGGQGA